MEQLDENKVGRHRNVPASEFDAKMLSVGVWVETEHGGAKDFDDALEIAKDHLSEDDEYYEDHVEAFERAEAEAKKGKGEKLVFKKGNTKHILGKTGSRPTPEFKNSVHVLMKGRKGHWRTNKYGKRIVFLL